MTASSPWTEGMIETRKSMERPRIFTRKRPSWGTRFSAMSSSAMTLMRLMIVEWCSLAIGFMAGCSTPSMRYLITTSVSRVSMWMSEARRLRASKTVESTSRMIGRLVRLDLVDGEDLLAVLVLAEDLDLEGLRGLLQHALRALAALQRLLDGGGRAHRGLDRRSAAAGVSSSTTGMSVGSAITSTSRPSSRR